MPFRRIMFKDLFNEQDGDTPARWQSVSGSFTISNKKAYTNALIGTAYRAVAPAENSVLTGTIPQGDELYYDVTIRVHSWGANGEAGFIFMASASAGTYFGDSYLVCLETNRLVLYKSASNVRTELSSASATHSVDTDYELLIHINTSTGDIDIYENDTQLIDYTDSSPLTSGNYLGLFASFSQVYWSYIKCRYPNCDNYLNARIQKCINKDPDTLILKIAKSGSSGAETDLDIGDGIEFVLVKDDGSEHIEFWGQVIERRTSDDGSIEVMCKDYLYELVKTNIEFDETSTIKSLISSIIRNNCRVLTNGDIKDSGDAARARKKKGENGLATIKLLTEEQGYYYDFGPERGFYTSDSFSASGFTINTEHHVSYMYLEDTNQMANKVTVYYNAGSTTAGGSGGAYETYGKRESVFVDKGILTLTDAQNKANTIYNRYGSLVIIIDVTLAGDNNLSLLEPGDTGTYNNDWLDLTSKTFLVLEKEMNLPEGNGVKFRLAVSDSAPPARPQRDITDTLENTIDAINRSLGNQVL